MAGLGLLLGFGGSEVWSSVFGLAGWQFNDSLPENFCQLEPY